MTNMEIYYFIAAYLAGRLTSDLISAQHDASFLYRSAIILSLSAIVVVAGVLIKYRGWL